MACSRLSASRLSVDLVQGIGATTRTSGFVADVVRRAKEIIEPGVLEPYVFGELHTAAVVEAGEPLSAQLGNSNGDASEARSPGHEG